MTGAKVQAAPELRFSGFDGKWNPTKLGEVFASSRAKGKADLPTLSVTLTEGLKNREELDRHTPTNLAPEEHLLVREGDIAYNMMRMWQGAFGRATNDGIVSPAYVVLRAKNGVDSRWSEYYFRRNRSIYWFWAYSYGLTSDRLRLYANDFAKVPAKLPSLPEQQKIADFLTAVDGRIGQLIQKKALLEDYKKGVMQQLFTQAIRFQDDHGNDFPDWEEKKLGKLLSFKNGYNAAKDQYGTGKKFINVLDIIENDYITHERIKGEVDIPPQDFEKNEVKFGDILFQRSSETREEVGQANVYLDHEKTATFGGFVIRGRPQVDFNPVYFNSMLKTPAVRKDMTSRSGGSTRYNIGQESLEEVTVRIAPSLDEQTKIANFLSALDRKIASVATQIIETQTFKRGLLQQMFV